MFDVQRSMLDVHSLLIIIEISESFLGLIPTGPINSDQAQRTWVPMAHKVHIKSILDIALEALDAHTPKKSCAGN
jgi:hypothetical protein